MSLGAEVCVRIGLSPEISTDRSAKPICATLLIESWREISLLENVYAYDGIRM